MSHFLNGLRRAIIYCVYIETRHCANKYFSHTDSQQYHDRLSALPSTMQLVYYGQIQT